MYPIIDLSIKMKLQVLSLRLKSEIEEDEEKRDHSCGDHVG